MNPEHTLHLAKLSIKTDSDKNNDSLQLPKLNFVQCYIPKLVVPKFYNLDGKKNTDHSDQTNKNSFEDEEYSSDQPLPANVITDNGLNNIVSFSQQIHADNKDILDTIQCRCLSPEDCKKMLCNKQNCVVQPMIDETISNIASQESRSSCSTNDRSDPLSQDNNYNGLPAEIAQQINVKYSGLKDIAGLEDVKQSLREAIIYPTRYPQLFTNGRSAWSRALLFGPPGVGKTALAHAVAAEANLPLYQVSSADLTSAWLGHTEKLIRRLFETLGRRRCILLFDEVDSFCRNRNSGDSAHSRRAATELLIQMQHYEGSEMFLLCATNCPWEIDPAFLRRFQQRIFVPLPESNARQKILLESMGYFHKIVPGEAWSNFLKATEGLTGSDLKNITRTALMLPLREMQSTTHWIETACGRMMPADKSHSEAVRCSIEAIPDHKVGCRPLKIEDLWSALEKTDKTVLKDSLEPFEKFMKDHVIK